MLQGDPVAPVQTVGPEDNVSNMEGYLFKRTTNAFKNWVRYVTA
jgi:hypothetical protein